MSTKIPENSFLKNGINEFRFEALIVSIVTFFSNGIYVHTQNKIFQKS